MNSKLRILSLLPSATEIVCALGLGDHLVAVSHECDFPRRVSDLPRATRTKLAPELSSLEIDAAVREQASDNGLFSICYDVIEQVKPNVVLTQSLCQVCAVGRSDLDRVVNLLESPTVIDVSAQTLGGVLDSIIRVGTQLDCQDAACQLVEDLQQRIRAVQQSVRSAARRRVLLLEWIDPPFAAGHWNPELINLAGGIDPFGSAGQASRQLSWDEIGRSAPDVVIVACCGFSRERTVSEMSVLDGNPVWSGLQAVREERVFVLDGSAYFNRPGPRLVDGLEQLAAAIHTCSRNVIE